jgi:hypothetical protein
MSAEDDLKRYKRDQDRQLFDELEEMQRRSQRAIEAKELAHASAQRGLRLEHINNLEPQIAKLGRLAGMSDLDAHKWAFDLVREAKRLMYGMG